MGNAAKEWMCVCDICISFLTPCIVNCGYFMRQTGVLVSPLESGSISVTIPLPSLWLSTCNFLSSTLLFPLQVASLFAAPSFTASPTVHKSHLSDSVEMERWNKSLFSWGLSRPPAGKTVCRCFPCDAGGMEGWFSSRGRICTDLWPRTGGYDSSRRVSNVARKALPRFRDPRRDPAGIHGRTWTPPLFPNTRLIFRADASDAKINIRSRYPAWVWIMGWTFDGRSVFIATSRAGKGKEKTEGLRLWLKVFPVFPLDMRAVSRQDDAKTEISSAFHRS